MMNEDKIAALIADWRRQPVGLDRARRLVERRERWVRFATWLHRAGAAMAPLLAGWFAFRAWTEGEALFALAATAMLVPLPLMLIVEYRSRRHARQLAPLDTPVLILQQARRQADRSRKLLWGCRWSAFVLLACAMLVWVLFGMDRATLEAARFLCLVWAGTATLVLIWERRRRRRLAAETEGCERLLTLFAEADG